MNFLKYSFHVNQTTTTTKVSILFFYKFNFVDSMLANTGPGGTTYPDFTPFDVDKIRCHVGIYILQGSLPSPRIEYKFNCQCDNPAVSSDYVWQETGGKGNRCCQHQHFKAFFSCQDSHQLSYDPPDAFLNWKIRPPLQWINFIAIGPLALILGRNIFVDEMIICCKGTHCDIGYVSHARIKAMIFKVIHFAREDSIINITREMNHRQQSILLVKGTHHFIPVYCGCLIVFF